MKLYNRIKDILTYDCMRNQYRNSDRKLIWKIWEDEGIIINDYSNGQTLDYENFISATSPETIRRTRQLVVANHPELQSDKKVLAEKKKKESTKGTFGYREPLTGKLFN